MVAFCFVLVFASIFLPASRATDLQARYPFSVVLFDDGDQYYELHWNFSRSTESIYFAVNVSTTGWVGLGLSPNGQMPGSDVIMGWVDNGGGYFADRYAEGRFRPIIDALSQDWFLTNSSEENGYTVLEFSRNFTSCDPQDLDITIATSRVVWSYSLNDPSDPSGSDAVRHDYMGARSINLIGGTPSVNTADLDNEEYLDLTVNDVTIPSADTTYWCETFRTPSQFLERTHYINRFGPALTEHPRAFVHHIIVYQCPTSPPLPESSIGQSRSCAGFNAADTCRSGLALGGWAVGGEDFVFPEGVAFPIGGGQTIMIEMHYDNPDMASGVVDNSGMRFYYTTEAPRLLAGSLSVGHVVTPLMLVPFGQSNFTITGICTAECTKTFPKEGIRIFANNFHTHLAGHGLTLQHFRYNEECGVLEELEPIDQNLRYDFNFQQTVILPKEHLVLPGDTLVLKCFYQSNDRDTIILGGASTRDEMCLSYAYYYPRPAPDVNFAEVCQSLPNSQTSFNGFYETLYSIDRDAATRFADPDPEVALSALNGIDWSANPVLSTSLEDSVTNTPGVGICYTSQGQFDFLQADPVNPGCSYEAPNKCTNTVPLSCCERAGAVRAYAPATMISFMVILIALYC